jgi:hypothetical protein
MLQVLAEVIFAGGLGLGAAVDDDQVLAVVQVGGFGEAETPGEDRVIVNEDLAGVSDGV